MLSSELRSKRAVLVNAQIMQTFVRLRRLLASHAKLQQRLDELDAESSSPFPHLAAQKP